MLSLLGQCAISLSVYYLQPCCYDIIAENFAGQKFHQALCIIEIFGGINFFKM